MGAHHTTSPLPLLNSLTHLIYLTTTSPCIREIRTCDGGLERLVHLLRDFCLSPPPTENPFLVFGLSPIDLPRPHPIPALTPKAFDRRFQRRSERIGTHPELCCSGEYVGSDWVYPGGVAGVQGLCGGTERESGWILTRVEGTELAEEAAAARVGGPCG